MKKHTPTVEEMSKRLVRFKGLVPYVQRHGDSGVSEQAFEKLSVRNVYSIMAPTDYKGRSAKASTNSFPGAVVSVAECRLATRRGLHCHELRVENFFCLNGKFKVQMWRRGRTQPDPRTA